MDAKHNLMNGSEKPDDPHCGGVFDPCTHYKCSPHVTCRGYCDIQQEYVQWSKVCDSHNGYGVKK